MSTFLETATVEIEQRPDASLRSALWTGFHATGLPSTTDEVWRYAPLSELALDGRELATGSEIHELTALAEKLRDNANSFVSLFAGRVLDCKVTDGLTIEFDQVLDQSEVESGLSRFSNDGLSLLNMALTPGTLRINIGSEYHSAEPIVVAHRFAGGISLPRVKVEAAPGSVATIVELFEGGSNGVVIVNTDYEIAQGANVHVVTYQNLDTDTFHIARSTAFLETQASFRQSVLAIGGRYDRFRNDAELRGVGASNELRTTFLGSGSQVHDFRTRQFHLAARTNSTLLSKGAVAESSRSIYTGLIEIEKGAKRTDARQTNHNLLLSPHAHADSVPNLDIRENDVQCAHASSVGPIDELQRWYLESRGVAPRDAEKLIIHGFFAEMLDSLPSTVAQLLSREVDEALKKVVGS